MNGACLLGSRDGTNTNIEKLIGSENVTLFGKDYYQTVALLRDNKAP